MMARFEYKVIPAPTRGVKTRDAKAPEARFARTIETAMNAMAADGWEFLRSEMLPSEERQGLTGSHTVYRHVLVFRRPDPGDAEIFAPQLLQPPAPDVFEDDNNDMPDGAVEPRDSEDDLKVSAKATDGTEEPEKTVTSRT